jgi:uncharacterized protein YlaI
VNQNDVGKVYHHHKQGCSIGIAPANDGEICLHCHTCDVTLFTFYQGGLTPEQREWFRSQAAECYEEEGRIEVDDGAMISEGNDPGAYVQAWVWVEAPRAKYLCPKCMSVNITAYVKRAVSKTVGIQHGRGVTDEVDVDEDTVKEEPPHEFKCDDCKHVSKQETDWVPFYGDLS